MKPSRLKYAMLNSTVLTLIQIMTIILKFITQTVFIRVLGREFLGLNGLFTNILSVLSFAELGVGTSIVFSLYKPLAENDKQQISALMNLFKKAYTFIGMTVGVLGCALIPFLHLLIKDFEQLDGVYIYFLLYLANSVISYFFTYKRSLLIADQHEYISMLNTFLFMVLQVILQVFFLFLNHSYAFYLWIAIICTFLSNVAISHKVNKDYPYLKKNSKEHVSTEIKKTIGANVVGMIGSRIGAIVVRSTDNLLLSSFMGIGIVGIYSNYLLIVNSISGVLNKLVSSVTASIGNLIVEQNNNRSYEVYKQHFMINIFVVSFSAGCLLVSLNPFIKAWAGKNYVLVSRIVLVIVINYFVDQLRQTNITFISAYGLFVPNGKKSVVEAILNFVLSLILLRTFKLGIAGVLLGTVITNIVLNSWWEPLLLFRSGFKIPNLFNKFFVRFYLGNSFVMIVIVALGTLVIRYFNNLLPLPSLVTAVMNSILMVIFMTIMIMIIYWKNRTFQSLIKMLKIKK